MTESPDPTISHLTARWQRLKAKYPSDELTKAVRTYRSRRLRTNLRWWAVRLLPLVIVIAGLYRLLQWEPFYTLVMVHTRLVLIHFVQSFFFDWTRITGSECLVDNPNFTPYPLGPEECKLCQNIPRIVRANANLSQLAFNDDFLGRERPVIVTKAFPVESWDISKYATVEKLHDLYVNNPAFRHSVACAVNTNIPLQVPNNKLLLRQVMDKQVRQWYAMWEHCGPTQNKAFRSFYKRPNFLPLSVDLAGHSWMFLSHSYQNDNPIPVVHGGRLLLFAQVTGSMRVKLSARAPCTEHNCPVNLYETLSPGDILAVTDFLWEVDIKPNMPGFSLALGLTSSPD